MLFRSRHATSFRSAGSEVVEWGGTWDEDGGGVAWGWILEGGGGARVCMRWDSRGACGVVGVSRNGVGIGWNKGFSDRK